MKLWGFYLAGALLTLAFKYIRYVRTARVLGKSTRTATSEWLFEASAENAFSWATTVGVVWVIGVIYIDRVDLLVEWLTKVPLHPAFAFLIGSVAEYAAPNAAKWILSKLTGGN